MSELWKKHWRGMPRFTAENKKPFHTIRIVLTEQKIPAGKPEAFVTLHFKKNNLVKKIAEVSKLLKKSISLETERIELNTDEHGLSQLLFFGEGRKIGHHSAYFPWKENDPHSKYVYLQEAGKVINPIYPVYIISKGRWELPLTARALERMGVPYTIVVEPKEYTAYVETLAGVYDKDQRYTYGTVHKAPEDFSERGQGSIPVRNYVWDLAIKTGKERHWLLDDNIPTFNRTNHNLGIRVNTGAILRAVEAFADRYKNVAFTGLQNSQFVISKWEWPAFFINTRVYSCTLIKNDLDLRLPAYANVPACTDPRWRGRYNEDTDLIIRALKQGWCTVLFVTFNADKVGTMTMKGGNTDELYAGNGRTKMAQSLLKQHPDVVKIGRRWNRDQHIVNYPACVRIGKATGENGGCELRLREGAVTPKDNDEFGMVLVNRKTGKKVKL